MILGDHNALLLFCQFVAFVNEGTVFSFANFSLVIRSHSININMQAHIPRQTLHANNPLQLYIAVHYILRRYDLRLIEISPLADPELHNSRLQ